MYQKSPLKHRIFALMNSMAILLKPRHIAVIGFIIICVSSAKVWSQSPLFGKWGVETQFISKTVLPGNDFYTYVNEGWLKSATIPAGNSGYGSYSEAGKKNRERIASVIQEGADTTRTRAKSLRQVGELYLGYLDTLNIERLGLQPIREDLKNILALKQHEGVARWMAKPKSHTIVSIHTGPDLNDRSRFLVTLAESGIGLPGPEWYKKTDGPYPGYRKAYIAYISHVFQLAGIPEGDRRAAEILDLESRLAALQWTPAQLRESKINAHLMSVSGLNKYAPGFPWKIFLASRQVAGVKEVILQGDLAIKAKAELFAKTPVAVWSSYLAFHWIVNHSTLLPEVFRKSQFNFYSTTLNGIIKDMGREQKAVSYVNVRVGQLVGKLYVERYFPAGYLQRTETLVEYVTDAFTQRLAKSDWLDEVSRREAKIKLDAVTVRIGYPKVWRDYSAITFDAKNPVANERRIVEADWDHERSLLTKAFTSKEWYQYPQTVDASSSKLYNSIEFPAGILQPPFFDPYADAAVNFGGIGAIIAHELGHCFDDEGSKFDGKGMIRDWWTAETRKSFDERRKVLVAQYDAFSPLEGLHVNGAQTVGENIGDLTGVAVAYEAYQLYLKDQQEGAVVFDGFTGNQRFFLAYAQVNRSLYTPEAYRTVLSRDYHAPAEYRVNGIIRNVDAWYKAFDIKPGDVLYLPPADRLHIW